MRPSRLAICNFGAYREKAEIDFRRLGPFFLVCGKTGSGKTTIFDAMTYALYGKVPGSREGLESQLWSQYALPGDKPLVEFEFFLGSGEFKASRVPPYKRSKRGGGLSDAPAEARVHRKRGEEWELIADSIREVNTFIETRIGLTVDEFSKIILLPQGEFQRFLQMPSPERVEVLEKLFPVALHDAVTELAREKDRDAAKAVRDLDEEATRRKAEAGEAPELRLAGLLEANARLKTEVDEAAEAHSSRQIALGLAREVHAREEKARLARERLELLEADSVRAAGRLDAISLARAAALVLPLLLEEEREARLVEDERKKLSLALLKIADLEAALPGVEAEKSRRLALAKEREALDRESGELQLVLASWRQRAEAESLCASAEAELIAARSAQAECASRLAKLEARLAELSVDAATESAARKAFGDASAQRQKAGERVAAATELVDLAAKAGKASQEETELRRLLEAAGKKLEAARSVFAAAEAHFLRDRAASLAAELAEGQPCPVCGSTHHPSPAAGSEGSVPESERARLKTALDKALAAEASAQTSLLAAGQTCEERRLYLADAASRHAAAFPDSAGNSPALESILADPASGLRNARNLLVSAEASEKLLRARLDELESRKVAAEKTAAELQALRAVLGAKTENLAAASAKMASAEARRDSAAERSGPVDPAPRMEAIGLRRAETEAESVRADGIVKEWESGMEVAKTKRAVAEERLESLLREAALLASRSDEALAKRGFAGREAARSAFLAEDRLAKLESESAAYAKALAGARAEVQALARDPDSLQEALPDIPALESQVAQAAELAQSRREALGISEIATDRLSRLLESLRELLARRAAEAERSATLHALSELLSGNLVGRRLPFKSFVLGMYFRTVVHHASQRLLEMSDGRYTLLADEGNSRGAGRIGLEILVRDSMTGQTRTAGTLSGGERFITAVSLALGLADTIRMRSGGVSLDAIFIDEGFGSLDEEALDRAIDVLDRIRGERMIGIVSHVAELRVRIPSQILVTGGKSGSTLEIVG
jgi:exonuclease SbcC